MSLIGTGFGSGTGSTEILWPGGKKLLKPAIKWRWPLKSSETRAMTPGVLMLEAGEVR